MKKLILKGLFLFLVGTGLVSCKKSENLKSVNESGKIEYRLDNIPIVKVPSDINAVDKDGADLDEQKLNQQLIDLAEATKDLMKNATFNALVVRIAKESEVNLVYYSQIKQQGLSFYNTINQNLSSKGLSVESITASMTHQPILPNPEYPETGELEIYEPAIFIPNSSRANPNLQPLISPNIESEIEDEDYILAWYFDETGIQKETMLAEATVSNSNNPIFILDHAIPKTQMDKISNYIKSTKDATPFPKSGSTYFESNRIKIKNGYRYEQGTGRSEFCIGGAIVRAGSPPANFLHLTNNNDHSLKIKEVTKSQVNSSSSVYVTSHHADNYTPYDQNKVYWNTFERDWNRSIKDLGNGATFGQTWYFWGRMRYTNDWYQWIPSTVSIHATPFEWFGWETVIPFSSWKSEYDLIKVN